MWLLELNIRVAITTVILALFLGLVVPRLMFYSEQNQLVNNVNELARASIRKVKLDQLASGCPSRLTTIDINALVSQRYLGSSWLDELSRYTVTVKHRAIPTASGTSYSMPSYVVIQYRFPTVNDARPFYGIADSNNGTDLSFVTYINQEVSELEGYRNKQNGCSVL